MYVPDQNNTQKMCDNVILENDGWLLEESNNL